VPRQSSVGMSSWLGAISPSGVEGDRGGYGGIRASVSESARHLPRAHTLAWARTFRWRKSGGIPKCPELLVWRTHTHAHTYFCGKALWSPVVPSPRLRLTKRNMVFFFIVILLLLSIYLSIYIYIYMHTQRYWQIITFCVSYGRLYYGFMAIVFGKGYSFGTVQIILLYTAHCFKTIHTHTHTILW